MQAIRKVRKLRLPWRWLVRIIEAIFVITEEVVLEAEAEESKEAK